MVRYLLVRVVRNLVTLFLLVTVLYVIFDALPGDYTTSDISFFLMPVEELQAMRRELGLDLPPHLGYIRWLRSLLSGEMGFSLIFRMPVRDVLWQYLPGTLLLFVTATAVSFFLGVRLGRVVTWRRSARADTAISLAGVGLYTSFTPLVALLLVFASAGLLGWRPPLGSPRGLQGVLFLPSRLVGGAETLGRGMTVYFLGLQPVMAGLLLTGAACIAAFWVLRRNTRHHAERKKARRRGTLIILALVVAGWALSGRGIEALLVLYLSLLPLLTLVLVLVGEPLLMTRTGMLETAGEDFVTTARAKGLREEVVRDRHAGRVAVIPLVSRVLLGVPAALTGTLAVEVLFSWPGLGSLLLSAADQQDHALTIGVLAFVGILVLIAHVLLDVLNVVLDPRVRRVAPWERGRRL